VQLGCSGERGHRSRRILVVAAAVGWGALAASSLVIGALLGTVRAWPDRLVGLVLAFGAGALISAVSVDLVQEGAEIGDPAVVALGLATGALTFFALDRMLVRRNRGGSDPAAAENAGTALALGAFLDGIPEQLVLGIGLVVGDGVSVGLLVAIFVSNLPEATDPEFPDPYLFTVWFRLSLTQTTVVRIANCAPDDLPGNLNVYRGTQRSQLEYTGYFSCTTEHMLDPGVYSLQAADNSERDFTLRFEAVPPP
jgi:hypothetical protein